MDWSSKFERAGAFVDGEMDRDARGEVLAEAARDPDLARNLSALHRLKAAVEDSIDVPEIALPEPRAGRTGRWRRARRGLGYALAACLALAAVFGIGWWIASPHTSVNGIPVAWAVDAHRNWRDAGAGPAMGGGALRPVIARVDAYVPDLSAARLRIAHVGELRTPSGKSALAVGYLGNRGCRVTLLVDATPGGLSATAVFFEIGGVQAMAWRAGRLRHLVLAEGMNTARFRLIAETVRRASLERLPVDEPGRVALAGSRAASPPCAA